MGSLCMRRIVLAGMVAMVLLTVGCVPSTRVNFQGPSGAVLIVDKKPYHLPAQVDLSRPSGAGGSTRHDGSLAFSSAQSQEIRAEGHIDMFGYNESDVDKLAVNTCILDETQLVKILDGTIVVFRG